MLFVYMIELSMWHSEVVSRLFRSELGRSELRVKQYYTKLKVGSIWLKGRYPGQSLYVDMCECNVCDDVVICDDALMCDDTQLKDITYLHTDVG